MLAPPQSLHLLLWRLCWQMLGSRPRDAPIAVMPRGTRGTCPAAFRARIGPSLPCRHAPRLRWQPQSRRHRAPRAPPSGPRAPTLPPPSAVINCRTAGTVEARIIKRWNECPHGSHWPPPGRVELYSTERVCARPADGCSSCVQVSRACGPLDAAACRAYRDPGTRNALISP